MFRKKSDSLAECCKTRELSINTLRMNKRASLLKRKRVVEDECIITDRNIGELGLNYSGDNGNDEITIIQQIIQCFQNEHIKQQLNINKIIQDSINLIKENNVNSIKCQIIQMYYHFSQDKNTIEIMKKFGIHFLIIEFLPNQNEDTYNTSLNCLSNMINDDIQLRDEVIRTKLIEIILAKDIINNSVGYLIETLLKGRPFISINKVCQLIPLIKKFKVVDEGIICTRLLLSMSNETIDKKIISNLQIIISQATTSLVCFQCIGTIFATEHPFLISLFIKPTIEILFYYATMICDSLKIKTSKSNIHLNLLVDETLIRTYLWIVENLFVTVCELDKKEAYSFLLILIPSKIISSIILCIFNQSINICKEAFSTIYLIITIISNIPQFIITLINTDNFFDIFEILFIQLEESNEIYHLLEIILILVSSQNIQIISKLNERNIFEQVDSFITSNNTEIVNLAEDILRIEHLYNFNSDEFEL
ncbi:hypothetical protein EDI_238040 [Entamoeba dispar SAW760]|uniref:Uncharacterized protein n=1 Tax=Entamoeba dispar (strain ATCC PRA-260 / SAW760) TaxID=370354 RepID=B0E8B4_ENTDS|nr:uncharacterized protein EDI_238040 [Entamoeba dispar SAW760]EDR29239.1 hypothetical protein EDI_238040 [Entamoeba dispar SAW760]|eukprot:EDR29239.1 hypothetical protein EDI_238040 [Entamoeba dispar SAW760]